MTMVHNEVTTSLYIQHTLGQCH